MKVDNKQQVLRLIQENSRTIRGYGVEKVGIFGSFTRDEQNNDSDVDLLVEFKSKKKTYRNFFRLASYIEDLVGRKVELITPQSISPHLASHVYKEVEYAQIGH